jgi:hypothetical protein
VLDLVYFVYTWWTPVFHKDANWTLVIFASQTVKASAGNAGGYGFSLRISKK